MRIMASSSVVVLIIDPHGVPALEFKSHAPVLVDPNGPMIDKVYRPETLEAAWRKVRHNAGAAGIDGQTVERFAARQGTYVHELEQALKSGEYWPQPVKRVEIPKGAGKWRALGIPAVKDRIVQTAVKLVIEPIFEREFVDSSYGFRPGRSCKQALREVDRLIGLGYTHVVDADVESYFDSIPHAQLVARVGSRVSDTRVLKLIEAFLQQDIIHGLQRWTPTGGTPQGAVVSPLLENIYLHPLDCHMRERSYRMVRYADDFVVLCRSAEEAQAALSEVQAWVQENGLKLNAGKTHVGDCRIRGEGFIRRRLPALLRKQQKRPGFGRCQADQVRWPNTFFAELGLFTMFEAHALDSQSR